MKKLGKKGALGAGGVIGIIAIVIIAVVAILFAFGVPQSIIKDDARIPLSDPVGTICSEDPPYIDNATVDDFLRGTSVGVTLTYMHKVNFEAGLIGEDGQSRSLTAGSSGTKFNLGDKLVILASATNYIDDITEFEITSCGKNDLTIFMQNSISTAAVLDILQDSTKVADQVNAVGVNITGSANNVAYTVRIDGTKDDTTGEMLLTIEGNDTEIADIILSASSGVAEVLRDGDTSLKLFVAEGTAPTYKAAFEIAAIEDGVRAEYLVTLIPETGKTLGLDGTSGFLYHNLYAAQWFVDDDGTFQYGFEDSDGTVKYENAYTDHDANVVA